MIFILCEYVFGDFTFDLLDIDFGISSSLLYINISKGDVKNGFEILYYKQLRYLFWMFIGKFLK